LYGGLLCLRCPGNFEVSCSADILGSVEHGAVYLELRKPLDTER
jgi:hypothetical protein